VGQGLLIIEDSRSHSDTPGSVGFLWMSDQPDAEASIWQQKTLTTDRPTLGGTRTHIPSKLAAAYPHLRPLDHRDRQLRNVLLYTIILL